MELQDLIEETRNAITGGGVLESDLEDAQYKAIVNQVLREVGRYWDESKFITVPFAKCIDLKDFNCSSVVKVYRTAAVGSSTGGTDLLDPAYAQQWLLFSSGGTMYNLSEYILNYASWSTLNQIRNTLSTDMSFVEDTHEKKLYINNYMANPGMVTIEYIPRIPTIEDVESDYWIDIITRMCVATAKIWEGRIRSRFKHSGAQWEQDGDTLLAEGNEELKELRERLRDNSNLIGPISSGSY